MSVGFHAAADYMEQTDTKGNDRAAGSPDRSSRLNGGHEATLICRRTGNRRAVQLLLGHIKIESTVRYLGIEVDNALAISEQIDV